MWSYFGRTLRRCLPVLILALAWVVLHQHPNRPTAIGTTLALGGVLLVAAQRDVGLSAVGVTLTIAGVMACAVYTVLSSRYLADSTALSASSCNNPRHWGLRLFWPLVRSPPVMVERSATCQPEPG